MKRWLKIVVSVVIIFVFYHITFLKETEKTLDQHQCNNLKKQNDVSIDNLVWQVLETPKGRLNLYNAYLDMRFDQKYVRINTIGPNFNESFNEIYCQFWFEDESKKPEIVKVFKFVNLWISSGIAGEIPTPRDNRIPFFLMCSFDHLNVTPTAVSLTLSPCQLADNHLIIIDNHPPDGVQKEFGVCTKQLSYDDKSFTFKFVEWIHMLRILGVEKVFGYNRFVHKDTASVIKYFEDKGWVEMYPFLEPQGTVFELTSWPTRAIERVLLNDCFYRNFNLFKYIAVIDPDEIFMPLMENVKNYHDLIESFSDHQKYDFFFFSYVYFSSNENDFLVQKIPAHHHMLRNVMRSFLHDFRLKAAHRYKSIMRTNNVRTIHHHRPTSCLFSKCNGYKVPTSLSYTCHYRSNVQEVFKGVAEDKTIWRYKDQLIANVNETLEHLKIYP